MEKKGALVYLALVFVAGFTYAGVALGTGALSLRESGTGDLLLLLVYLYIPALAALIARRAAPAPRLGEPALRPGGWKRVLATAVSPLAVVIVVHLFITLFGLARPDWNLGKLSNALEDQLAQLGQPMPYSRGQFAAIMLVLAPAASVLLGMTVYALIALGNELGWRGFLQRRLMGYGRIPAYAVTAVCWMVWLFPLYIAWLLQVHGREEGAQLARAMLPRFALMLLALTCILGEVQRRANSAGLAAVFLGGFYAQSSGPGSGIWPFLFPNPVEPWTGTFGWVSVIVWALVAAAVVAFPQRINEAEAARKPGAGKEAEAAPRPKSRPKSKPGANAGASG